MILRRRTSPPRMITGYKDPAFKAAKLLGENLPAAPEWNTVSGVALHYRSRLYFFNLPGFQLVERFRIAIFFEAASQIVIYADLIAFPETIDEACFLVHQLELNVLRVIGLLIGDQNEISLCEIVGDLFGSADVVDCSGLYDRAALIALPEGMRERYAAHLAAILPSGCAGLLVTLDYPQAEMSGPPFAVDEALVAQLLTEQQWACELLEQADVLGQNWRFLQRGLTRLDERAYRLRKR